ncbi:MAG: hypothetical protein K0R63_788 [Rickettsiales bacterium]|jgi:hypothetical protein|nr:hypothetical protein [Rickettsiales bacterium]
MSKSSSSELREFNRSKSDSKQSAPESEVRPLALPLKITQNSPLLTLRRINLNDVFKSTKDFEKTEFKKGETYGSVMEKEQNIQAFVKGTSLFSRSNVYTESTAGKRGAVGATLVKALVAVTLCSFPGGMFYLTGSYVWLISGGVTSLAVLGAVEGYSFLLQKLYPPVLPLDLHAGINRTRTLEKELGTTYFESIPKVYALEKGVDKFYFETVKDLFNQASASDQVKSIAQNGLTFMKASVLFSKERARFSHCKWHYICKPASAEAYYPYFMKMPGDMQKEILQRVEVDNNGKGVSLGDDIERYIHSYYILPKRGKNQEAQLDIIQSVAERAIQTWVGTLPLNQKLMLWENLAPQSKPSKFPIITDIAKQCLLSALYDLEVRNTLATHKVKEFFGEDGTRNLQVGWKETLNYINAIPTDFEEKKRLLKDICDGTKATIDGDKSRLVLNKITTDREDRLDFTLQVFAKLAKKALEPQADQGLTSRRK